MHISANPSLGGGLTSVRQGVIVVGRFNFKGDGLNIPYNTLLAAKGRRTEKEELKV